MLRRSISLGLTSVFNAKLVIPANTNNYNLSTSLQALGWSTSKRARVEVTINAGVTVGSASTGSPAFLVNIKDIDYVTLINNGNILGAAGAGGSGGVMSNGGAGGNGGTALQAQSNVRIINNGVIGGGGGGNGGDGTSITSYTYLASYTPRCNGNDIYISSTGGTCGRCQPIRSSTAYNAACTPNYATGYTYPNGSPGASGGSGSGLNGNAGASPYYGGGAGGAAGNYYQGSSKITVITAGTVRGGIVA